MCGGVRNGVTAVARRVTAAVSKHANQTPSHADHCINFDTIAAFARRTGGMYNALECISKLLPPGAPATQAARRMVAEQRKWLLDAGNTVGAVVGGFYQLEKNTLDELNTMLLIGQQNLTMAGIKRNFKSTRENLGKLEQTRVRVLQTIEDCEALGQKMVVWDNEQQAQSIQHACIEMITHQFGGSAEVEALIDKLAARRGEIQQNEEQVKAAVKDFQQAIRKCEDLRCRLVVYRSVAEDEKASMDVLQQRAKDLQERAAKEGEAAAQMNNTPYKFKFLFFYGAWDADNSTDRKDEIASKLKRLAKEVMDSKDDQVSRSKRAQAELAEIEGELRQAEDVEQRAKAKLDECSAALEKLYSELRDLTKEAEDKQKSFGNIPLQGIALLRDSMQKLPELLGSSGAQNSGMLEMFKGALQRHELLLNRMTAALAVNDEAELRGMLHNELLPMIMQARSDAHFFAERMPALKDEVDHQVQTPSQRPPLPPPEAGTVAPPPPGTFSLRDDNYLWG